MTAKNKARGNRFEREVVSMAKEANLNAKRAWGSDGRSLGEHEEVDVILWHNNPTSKWTLQCKRRKAIPDWLVPSKHVHAQIIRADRKKAFAVVDLELFFELVKSYEGV